MNIRAVPYLQKSGTRRLQREERYVSLGGSVAYIYLMHAPILIRRRVQRCQTRICWLDNWISPYRRIYVCWARHPFHSIGQFVFFSHWGCMGSPILHPVSSIHSFTPSFSLLQSIAPSLRQHSKQQQQQQPGKTKKKQEKQLKALPADMDGQCRRWPSLSARNFVCTDLRSPSTR